MLLTLETTAQPATDLGYLLHKNPDRLQSVDLPGGQAHVFYPVADAECCRAAVMLDLDPVQLVRGRPGARAGQTLDQYVNDRPYVASSMMSVALGRLFGTALNGRSKERPELAETPIPLTAELAALPCRGGEAFLRAVFEPLGYRVEAERIPLAPRFPEWGDGRLFRIRLKTACRLRELLEHLYVLIPVLDDHKHYWVGDAEIDKLMARGGDWLGKHPERERITRRYLRHQRGLTRSALARMADDEEAPDATDQRGEAREQEVERPLSLNDRRLRTFLEELESAGARSVVDLGCGEGKLLRELVRRKQFTQILGVDVSPRALKRAARRLRLDTMPERLRSRIELKQGSLVYADPRLRGYDAAVLMEVVEHVDPARLPALERCVFEVARPDLVLVSTPNAEYNAMFETLPAGRFRHDDHRFEWTRGEFQGWAQVVAERHAYRLRFLPIGDEHAEHGPPTQLAVFQA